MKTERHESHSEMIKFRQKVPTKNSSVGALARQTMLKNLRTIILKQLTGSLATIATSLLQTGSELVFLRRIPDYRILRSGSAFTCMKPRQRAALPSHVLTLQTDGRTDGRADRRHAFNISTT